MLTGGSIRGLEVWVERANGTRFNEHATKVTPATDTEPLTTECWLESEDDQVFGIRLAKLADCRRGLTQTGWACSPRVDGRKLAGSVVLPGRLMNAEGKKWTHTAVQTAQGLQVFALQFRSHESTSEANDVTISATDMAKLGLIEVHLIRGSLTASGTGLPRAWKSADQGPLLEGSMKMGSKVGYVNPRPAEMADKYTFTPHSRSDKSHEHKFVFKYRTRLVLERMNIIESDTTNDSADDNAKTPPRQPGGKKRPRPSSPIHIDLTEDDDEEAEKRAQDKIEQQNKRIRYLEGLTAKLHARVKKEKLDGPPADQFVDISGEDA